MSSEIVAEFRHEIVINHDSHFGSETIVIFSFQVKHTFEYLLRKFTCTLASTGHVWTTGNGQLVHQMETSGRNGKTSKNALSTWLIQPSTDTDRKIETKNNRDFLQKAFKL